MRQKYRFYCKIILSSASIFGTTFFVNYQLGQRDKLHAFWQNNSEPSTKWDYDWDKRQPTSASMLYKQGSKSARTDQESLKGSSSTPAGNPTYSTVETKFQDDMDLGKKCTKARRHILLIRHGQYQIANPKDKQGLTQLGREQAELCGKRLKELASKYKFTKITNSTMLRALETSQLISKELSDLNLPIKSDVLLCEGAPFPPEPPVDHWKPDIYEFFQDGSRIEAAFRKYFFRAPPEQLEDSYEIIVCHANVIRYFFCRAMQFPPEAWLRFELGHASITHLIIKPDGRVGCRTLGEVGFLPPSKSTS